MTRRRTLHTRTTACASVARGLREFGYPSCTTKMIEECLAAWLAGKREGDLPHHVIGMFASRQFDEIEQANPGYLAELRDAVGDRVAVPQVKTVA